MIRSIRRQNRPDYRTLKEEYQAKEVTNQSQFSIQDLVTDLQEVGFEIQKGGVQQLRQNQLPSKRLRLPCKGKQKIKDQSAICKRISSKMRSAVIIVLPVIIPILGFILILTCPLACFVICNHKCFGSEYEQRHFEFLNSASHFYCQKIHQF